MAAATVGIYYDGRMSKEGEFYVKYVVYFQGKQKYYSTGMKVDKEDAEFLKKYKGGLTGSIKDSHRRDLWNEIYGDGLLRKAVDLIERLGPDFSFEAFAQQINKPVEVIKPVGGLLSDMTNYAERLRGTDNVGDASLYESAVVSLRRFSGKEELMYSEVTADFLSRYERWMLREGKAQQPKRGKDGEWLSRPGVPASLTTIGMYLRQVRNVFNMTKQPKEIYPFGKDGYTIPSGRNIKKALTKEDIGKIIAYQTENLSEMQARDLWLFSYLSNGINFIDILNLKWKDMDAKGGIIEFIRGKTRNTKKSSVSSIQIDLFPITKAIIEKWGDKSGEYIFPMFKKGMTAQRKKEVKAQVVKNTNKYVRRIAQSLGITADVTTYTARHSFATILMQSEAPLAFISSKLGHSSISTTQNYLGSFESSQAKKYLANLLPGTEEN